MVVGDGPVDTDRVGDLGRGPFGLVHVEVKQDPPPSRILEGADRAINLG
jgi:hypothetical protein